MRDARVRVGAWVRVCMCACVRVCVCARVHMTPPTSNFDAPFEKDPPILENR
jgi:hypothetical protein